MSGGVLLFILIFVILRVGGVVVVLQKINPPPPVPTPVVDNTLPTATPIVLQQVIVAVQQLPRGIRIPETALATRLWPKRSVPERAMTTISALATKLAPTHIFIPHPIIDTPSV